MTWPEALRDRRGRCGAGLHVVLLLEDRGVRHPQRADFPEMSRRSGARFPVFAP